MFSTSNRFCAGQAATFERKDKAEHVRSVATRYDIHIDRCGYLICMAGSRNLGDEPQSCGMTTATSSRRSARAASRESVRPR